MRSFVLSLATAGLALTLACGGKEAGSANGGGSLESCMDSSGSPPACLPCLQKQCPSQLAQVESGCSDLFTCACPGGVFDASQAQACTAKAAEASCTAAESQMSQCSDQLCLNECATGTATAGNPMPGCTAAPAASCGGDAFGFLCSNGDNPSLDDPLSACSAATASGGQNLYCCFSGPAWSPATCMPDNRLTSVCLDPTTYGFVCTPGSDPASLEVLLRCSKPTPDPDGVHDDFCCVYG